MDLYKSSTYIEDLDFAVSQTPILDKLSGTAVFITGGTGLICSAVVDLLLYYSHKNKGSIKVYVAGRNKDKVITRFAKYANSDFFEFVLYDANKTNQLTFHCDYVIHGASNAFPSLIQQHPIDTMNANINGIQELLEYSVLEKVKNTVFISSSEVYGKKDHINPFTEEEYGYVDILNPRSSYAVSKRAAETLCISYSHEKGISTSIIRPGHIYGPTASRADNRISSIFAYNASEGKDLVLKSDGSQMRSYCYMLDCATAIVTVLIKGKSGNAYNVSNPESVMTIKDIAMLFAEYCKTELKFAPPNDLEIKAFNPMSDSSLNSEKLQSLGWRGLFSPNIGVEHTITIIKEAMCNKENSDA